MIKQSCIEKAVIDSLLDKMGQNNQMISLFYIAAGDNDQIIGDGVCSLSEIFKCHGIQQKFHELKVGKPGSTGAAAFMFCPEIVLDLRSGGLN